MKKSNGKLYWYGHGGDVLQETNLNREPLAQYSKGGQIADSEGNLREALIAEDRVRHTDPERGLKIRHQNSGQILRTTDLPRITNPGTEP